ncbi:MAG: glycosyltransferase family 4 protein [Pseudomonadota bacterium]
MKTRLAILTRNFSRIGGGAESYAVYLATSMLKECEITVVSQSFDESLDLFHHVPVPKLPFRMRWVNQLWFSWYTRRATRDLFDVVHSYENVTHGDVHTVSVKTVHASLKQRAMSAFRIALSPRLLAYLWLEKRRLCGKGHHIVFVSQFLHDETLEILPEVPSSSVVPPGVDIPAGQIPDAEKASAQKNLGLNPGILTVGFVGHDFKKKGLGTLLRGAALLPFDIQIMVVGNPAQAERYSDLVEALGKGKTCHFMGVLRDMPNAYAAMDCLAHPTTQDVFPMVLLEAMAKHVPVVTTAEPYNNMGSLLVDHVDAILLPTPEDVDGMASALSQIWLDKPFSRTLASNGFLFAKKYSWDIAKARYYEAYGLTGNKNKVAVLPD